MTTSPVICFGQQPCGFFPRRYLYAKIQTARRLQSELGGEIVFFCHDSDHDFRETRTTLRHRKTGEPIQLNFAFDEPDPAQVLAALPQARSSPTGRPGRRTSCGLMSTPAGSRRSASTTATNAAEFCLEMYRRMGLLEGIRVARSSDPAFRRAACDVDDYFVDVPYEGEVVRARLVDGCIEAVQGRRQLRAAARDGVHQGADQPDSRHPAPLDAIGRALHPLRGRGQRAGLPAQGGRAGDHLRRP